jgi:hypothetical protein
MVPFNLFVYAYNTCSLDIISILEGIEPDKRLFDKFKLQSAVNLVMVVGMDPVSLFIETSNVVRPVNFPISDGIVPAKLLSINDRYSNAVSNPIVEGMVPVHFPISVGKDPE